MKKTILLLIAIILFNCGENPVSNTEDDTVYTDDIQFLKNNYDVKKEYNLENLIYKVNNDTIRTFKFESNDLNFDTTKINIKINKEINKWSKFFIDSVTSNFKELNIDSDGNGKLDAFEYSSAGILNYKDSRYTTYKNISDSVLVEFEKQNEEINKKYIEISASKNYLIEYEMDTITKIDYVIITDVVISLIIKTEDYEDVNYFLVNEWATL